MIELAILGFLAEQPQHGYELRGRIAQLVGHAKPISDGTLYPAISRMEKSGRIKRRQEPGTVAAPRQTLELISAGRAELLRRLRQPGDLDITNSTRFFVVLAFLDQLRDPAAQAEVLRKRLTFLEAATGFFHTGTDGVFRRGMLQIARATSKAEKAWLRETIAELGKTAYRGYDQ